MFTATPTLGLIGTFAVQPWQCRPRGALRTSLATPTATIGTITRTAPTATAMA